jgi:fermentation-respiration switch protein FrsA (DUF1100 family)
MNTQYETLLNLCLIILAVIIIAVLVVKRFVYFQPSSVFINTIEPYKVINRGHIHSWLLEGTLNKVILFCHGNAGNISHREKKVSTLNKLGYSVLIFDYSGYGKSGGIPSEQNCFNDASIMVAYLRESYNPNEIIIYGESLGAPIATYVARRYSIPTVILESSLPSVKILIKNKFKILSFLSFLFPEFDTSTYLDGYLGRSLILHSVTDEIVPYETTHQLRKLATQHIQITGSHNLPIIPWDKIKGFIETQPV